MWRKFRFCKSKINFIGSRKDTLLVYLFLSLCSAKSFLLSFMVPPAYCVCAQRTSLSPDTVPAGAAGETGRLLRDVLSDCARQMIDKNDFYLLRQFSAKQHQGRVPVV